MRHATITLVFPNEMTEAQVKLSVESLAQGMRDAVEAGCVGELCPVDIRVMPAILRVEPR